MRSWRLAALLIAAAAVGCAEDPIAGKVATHDTGRAGDPAGPAKVATLMRVAAATEQAGDFATAATFYRRAHDMNVHLARADAAPLLGLGRTLLALGAHNEAAETYRTALGLAPNDTEALRGLGNALIALDQPMAAITNFEAALAKGPDARLYSGLGVAYDLLDKRAAAQAAYRKGLELDPSNIALHNNLGLSLAFSGEFEEGIAILERAAADPRATVRQKLNLALAYGLAGEFAAAEAILRQHLDATSTSNNLAYYKTLQALNDRKLAARSVGAHARGPAAAGPRQAAEALDGAAAPRSGDAAAPPATGLPLAATDEAAPPAEPATGPPLDLVRDAGQTAAPSATERPPDTATPARPAEAARDAEVSPAPAPPPAAPSTSRSAAQVQFAAFRSKAQAEASWRGLSAAAPDLLAGIAPVIEEGYSGSDPEPYFRVRSAALASRGEANELCGRLKERGIDCMIVRGAP